MSPSEGVLESATKWPVWAALSAISILIFSLTTSLVALLAVALAVMTLMIGELRQRFTGYLLGAWILMVVFSLVFTPA